METYDKADVYFGDFFPKKVQLFIHNVRSTSIDKYLNKEECP